MNPVLKQMGFGADDRVVVIHADDVGMCQASTQAFADLLDDGLVTSGSIMVPCPWFPAAAALCRARPAADLGVHATLTCEYAAYRWGSLTGRDPASGLLDADGYLPARAGQVWERAAAAAAVSELEAQLDRAAAAGVDVTHLDDHMASMLHPRLLPHLVDLALRRGLPLRFLRPVAHPGESDFAVGVRRALERAEAAGMPFFDYEVGLPLEDARDHAGRLRAVLEALAPGTLTLVVAHPAKDTPELRAIAVEDWPGRVANYQALMDRGLGRLVRRRGIQRLGFRPLRQALRAALAGQAPLTPAGSRP